ncbi:MAG: response regulator [Planctomycetes bacterium]|nr:response regulator [Planctomycetota bacterium]
MSAKSSRILVIDDDPLFRSLIASLLRKHCIVAVASEGLEAFQKALQHTPDVAIIDVNMHGWDGIKTLKKFRAHPTLRQVKLIMLTADSSKETVLTAIQAGANDYLIKAGFSKSELFRKLNRLIPDHRNKLQIESPVNFANLNGGTTKLVEDSVLEPALAAELQPTQTAAPAEVMNDKIDDDAMQEIMDAWE